MNWKISACTKTENMSASALKTHVKDDAQMMQFFGVWKNETFVWILFEGICEKSIVPSNVSFNINSHSQHL